jgi:hypothetical protein
MPGGGAECQLKVLIQIVAPFTSPSRARPIRRAASEMSRTLTSTNPALTKRSTSGEAPPPISMTGVVASTPSDWISYGELMAQAGDLGARRRRQR